jgi:hypothetical protein
MRPDLRFRGAGRDVRLAVVFLLNAHLQHAPTAPIEAVRSADAPQLGPVDRARRIGKIRFRHLHDCADGGGTDVDNILAAVIRNGVAAARHEDHLVAPIAGCEGACQAHFSGRGSCPLVGKTDDHVLGLTAWLDVGIEIRKTYGVVVRRSKHTCPQQPIVGQLGGKEPTQIHRRVLALGPILRHVTFGDRWRKEIAGREKFRQRFCVARLLPIDQRTYGDLVVRRPLWRCARARDPRRQSGIGPIGRLRADLRADTHR